jgi:phospholipid transport system substrate-binding protein
MTDRISNLTRRQAMAGMGASVFALMASAVPAFAFSEAQARTLIDKVVADINGIINSGKSEGAMLNDFERIFSRYADVSTISRSVLGPPARSASAAQLSGFAKAFQTYISRKYGRRFREFIGGRVEVNSTRAVKSFFEVNCTTILKGEAPFKVTFVVAAQSGRFIDISIEGISLLKAERAEVGAMLDQRRGDINALIRDLPKL